MTVFSTALRWYKTHGRDLPWRKTRNPYHVLLSEIMLQQTQVDRVIFYYSAWLKQFPTWRALATAKKSDVIKAWSGLGYNRRALFLKSAAEEVLRSGLPETEDGWRKLKGVGTYTARAVSAFSQNARTLPIDTNIRRVLGRALLGKLFPKASLDARIESAAMKQYPSRGNHQDIPQALFDIASFFCTKVPDCTHCPLQKQCRAASAFLSGRARIPRRSIERAKETIREGKKYPDRIYRGRIVRAVNTSGPMRVNRIGSAIDAGYEPKDKQWILAMIQRLEKDGLIECKNGRVDLPAR